MADMTYSEIGSYFWLDGREKTLTTGEINWLPSAEDSTFTFSGRNAIDAVIRDILKSRKVDRVLAPSYCCVSMLQPFIDRGLKVVFYEVGYRDGMFYYEIPETDACTIVLIMSYFGLSTEACHEEIRIIHESGAVVIEDITHSLFCNAPACEESDYLAASLRKWFAVPAGGWAGKRNGKLAEKPGVDSNHAVEDKIAGMKEKYDYLTGKIDSKENYLLTQAKFDNDLIHVDRMLKIDDTSLGILRGVDAGSVIERRRKNAAALLAGLRDLDGKILKLPKMDPESDTPLFLPVFMETEDRDDLRKHLVSKGFYCSVHWPEIMGAEAGIRANELSLICDQRYGEGDMKALVDEIHAWCQEQGVKNS